MTRSKLTLAYIANNAQRKASMRKRKKGLINKVREISTLCGVDACAILYSPDDMEPEIWPSRAGAEAVVNRFRSLPEMDRRRKMVNLESFNRKRIEKMQDRINRLRRESDREDTERFMYRCLAGMESLNARAEMVWVMNQELREVTSKMDALKVKGQEGTSLGAAAAGGDRAVEVVVPPPPPPAVAARDDDNLEDYWLSLVESPSESGGLGWDL